MLHGLARKEQKKSATPIPDFWKEEVLLALSETYAKECQERKKHFELWGEIFSNEVLLISTLVNSHRPEDSATTFFISSDLGDGQDSKELLKVLVDALGMRFDDYFSQEDWSDYFDSWQEMQIGKNTLFTKSCRENISLTLKANQILSAAGFDSNGESYDD